jgi:hypothetical protein
MYDSRLGGKAMSKPDTLDQPSEKQNEKPSRRRHPITTENSPEETMKRMASFPERAAKFREKLRALREANSR